MGKPGNPPVWGTGERRFESGRPDSTRLDDRDVGKPGNPPGLGPGDRRFESGHPDWNWRRPMRRRRLKRRPRFDPTPGSWCSGSTADF